MTVILKCKLPKNQFVYLELLKEETLKDAMHYLTEKNKSLLTSNFYFVDDKNAKINDLDSKKVSDIVGEEGFKYLTVVATFTSTTEENPIEDLNSTNARTNKANTKKI